MSDSKLDQDSQKEWFYSLVDEVRSRLHENTTDCINKLHLLDAGVSFVLDYLTDCEESSAVKSLCVASELRKQLEKMIDALDVEEESINNVLNYMVRSFENFIKSSATAEPLQSISVDDSVLDLTSQIARLKTLGLGQAQIIYAIWGERQGSGKGYQKALEQYKAFDTTGKAKFVVSPEIHPSDRAVPNDLWNSLAEDTVDQAA